MSSTLGGFNAASGDGHGPDGRIISYRPLSHTEVRIDEETGQAELEVVEDPIAGEVFDTPEFTSSQEYLDQGGSAPSPQADEAQESEPAARGASG